METSAVFTLWSIRSTPSRSVHRTELYHVTSGRIRSPWLLETNLTVAAQDQALPPLGRIHLAPAVRHERARVLLIMLTQSQLPRSNPCSSLAASSWPSCSSVSAYTDAIGFVVIVATVAMNQPSMRNMEHNQSPGRLKMATVTQFSCSTSSRNKVLHHPYKCSGTKLMVLKAYEH